MRSSQPVTSRLFLIRCVEGLRQLGVDVAAVLERVGLQDESLNELEEQVPLSTNRALWDAVIEVTGQRGYGLRLSQLIDVEMWDVFGYVLRTSATLGDACVRAGRFLQLLTNSLELSLRVDGQRGLLTFRKTSPGAPHPEVSEFLVGAIGRGAHQITGSEVGALEVRFAHAPPPDATLHRELLGCPVYFDRPHTAVVFPSELLTLPVQTRDPDLCAQLEQQAQRMLEELPPTATLTRRVQELIATELNGGTPSVGHVAHRLGVHTRTLGRHLRSEGTSFQQLLDQLRHEMADRYLSDSTLSISEVAFLLGYSDASAFNKAFRRWTGVAPHEYRRRASA